MSERTLIVVGIVIGLATLVLLIRYLSDTLESSDILAIGAFVVGVLAGYTVWERNE